MRFTKHSLIRSRQRGFNQDMVYLIYGYGTEVKRPGNAREIVLRKKDLEYILGDESDTIIGNKIRNYRDKLRKKRLLIAQGNHILTVYNGTRERRYYA